MALSIRRKRASKPEVTTARARSAARAAGSEHVRGRTDAAWREKLTATKPKGRFTYGENLPGYRK